MIEVNLKWGLGNKMFQYAFGRILAEQKGYSLRCDGIPEFPNTSDKIRGEIYHAPEERLISGYFYLDQYIANPAKRKILIDGHFQNFRYFKPYRDRIKKWFARTSTSIDYEDATVIHVRRGDYVSMGWALPFSYYRKAIEITWDGASPLYIATDDREDPFFRNFEEYAPKYVDMGPVDTILAMSQAKSVVMSRSSFSWWAAFLGDHETVVCPDPSEGFWSEEQRALQSVDLVDEEDFLCLPCEGVYAPSSEEKRYLLLQNLRRKLRLPRQRTPSDFHL